MIENPLKLLKDVHEELGRAQVAATSHPKQVAHLGNIREQVGNLISDIEDNPMLHEFDHVEQLPSALQELPDPEVTAKVDADISNIGRGEPEQK